MSDDEKKLTSQSPASSSSPPKPVAQLPPTPSPAKGPAISRRAFLVGAMGASALLTIASVSSSGGILNPLLPPKEGPTVVAKYQDPPLPNGTDLNSRYMKAKGTSNEYNPSNYSEFFYYPYPVIDSPYYKNVISRLPDPLLNPYYANDPDPVQRLVLSHVVAFNLTCVHLRCIVNPGYSGTPGSGEFRLQCPCHGSQYRLTDAHPVAGPAYDLGLLPLPRVKLQYDSATGNITAIDLDGDAGIGRTD